MKSKLQKPDQAQPVGRSYSLFLSPDERMALTNALVINYSIVGITEREAKESLVSTADQVRSRAVCLQMVLDGVLKIQVSGQGEPVLHFVPHEGKGIGRNRSTSSKNAGSGTQRPRNWRKGGRE